MDAVLDIQCDTERGEGIFGSRYREQCAAVSANRSADGIDGHTEITEMVERMAGGCDNRDNAFCGHRGSAIRSETRALRNR